MNIILLLSAGVDSKLALKRLLTAGNNVVALCISGKEGNELKGAKQVAEENKIILHVLKLNWYDEQTYDFLQLVCRNMFMLFKTIQLALKYKAKIIATGIKKCDLLDKRLWWVPLFWGLGILFIHCFGISFFNPIWDEP